MSVVTTVPATDLGPKIFSRDPEDFGVPLGREEEWRYTPIRDIKDFFQPQDWGTIATPVVPFVEIVNRGDSRLSSSWMPTDRISAVAYANVEHVVLISIPDQMTVHDSIVVNLSGKMLSNYAHVEVHAGRFSRCQIVIIHESSANVSGSIVVEMGDQADVTLLSVIDAEGPIKQHWSWTTNVGRDCKFLGLSISLGGEVVRIVPTINYTAPGGSAEMLGAFLLQGDQYQEHRIMVNHTEPHCVSNVIYKGALSGQGAHSVWVGDVLVRREAVGIQTYELNRNLLLNDGPRADSVPNLELETGDVISAGHASATGRFDDEQLFYLQSRGIPELVARQLVVRGFFVDVLNKVNDQTLRANLLERIEMRLGMVSHA